MRYIHIDSVESGQKLGKTIYSSNGTVLLAENVALTLYMINTLKRIGVSMIYIIDEAFADVEIEESVSDETKRIVVKQMVEVFDSIRSGKDFSARNVSVSIGRLLEEIMQNQDVLIQLTDIRTKENDMYIHALNVCMMSIMVGMHLDLNASQLKDLAIGALFHDIGKIGLDETEANDTAKLSTDDVRKKHHAWRGFDYLKDRYSLMVAHIALQHHEAPDGSGEPRGLEDEQIHQFGKIVAVANMYDNLLFDQPPGSSMLPHEACEHLMALSDTVLDYVVLVQFLRMVSIYPTGSSVRLSNNMTGVVVGQHRGLPGRPIVRIVNRVADDDFEVKEIDLAKETTIFIESVLI